MTNYILQQIKDKQFKSRPEQLPYLKIMDSEPLLPSMEDKKYDTMMEHIRQLLDKRKPRVSLPVQQKTKGGRSVNGSKRHMVEVRFKEQYLSRQQQVQTQVTHDSVLRDSQTARVLEYQQRIGLVKRKTKCDLQLQQIAQKHNIRW